MAATKKTTTRKKTTTKSEKEEMKVQSFFKYAYPNSSYVELLFTPFDANDLTNELKNNWNKDGIFSTLIGIDKKNETVNYGEDISKIQYWVPFAVPAKYVRLIRGYQVE